MLMQCSRLTAGYPSHKQRQGTHTQYIQQQISRHLYGVDERGHNNCLGIG